MKIPKKRSALRKLGIIAWNDLQTSLQGRMSWFFLIGIPVLMICLIGLGARGFAKSAQLVIRIDVLDRDDTTASRAFVAALADANEAFVLSPALSSESAQERLADEVTSAFITIPKGFAAALEKGDKTTLTFQPGAALVAPALVFAAAQNIVTRLGGPFVAARLSTELAQARGIETDPQFYAARLAEAQASWGPPPVQVQASLSAPNEKLIFGAQLMKNGFKLSVPSITVIFVMISILGMIQSLTEEREAGILRRLGMMPVTKAQLLGGKLLATFLLGWVQFAVLVVFGEWLGVGLGGAPLATMVVASAYVLAVTAMALALAALARTPSQASAIATIAWVVLSMLGGAWWPLIFVPPWMRTLGHLSPVAWCLDALNALIFRQGTWSDVLLPSGVLALFAAGCFVFGVRALDRRPAGGSVRTKTPTYFGIRTLDSE
ncbi:MAG: ABC transporter permease [Candidatus Aminicenantes bacterium]|nr:ABC transporter permease [Candidatus Aminicenantes bacterium]